jgi:glycosyltransferase 2 family protein
LVEKDDSKNGWRMSDELPMTTNNYPMSPSAISRHAKKKFFRRVLSWSLISAGFLWVAWLIIHDGTKLWSYISELSWQWLIISLGLGSISIMPNALIFYILLKEQPGITLSMRYAARLLFVGQMVRHLPGRFWGVAYQVNSARKRIPSLTLVKINVDFTLIFLAFNTLFPLVIIVFYQANLTFSLLLFVAGSSFLVLCLRFDWTRFFLMLIGSFLPKRFADSVQNYLSAEKKKYPWRSLITIMLLLMVGWLCYLLAWKSFNGIFPFFENDNMIVLCAIYSLAWAVGFLSMVTPAGLGVREATFVFLAGSVATQSTMALLALFARVWLLVIDMILFFIVLPIKGDAPDE